MPTVNKPLWEVFPHLNVAVRKDHERMGATGGAHDFVHALMVAQYAVKIAENDHTGKLAWIAGLCHNTDRLFPEDAVERIIQVYMNLSDIGFVDDEKALIVEAVLEHHKLNNDNDNPVTITVKDADRLANVSALLLVRAGQFYPNLPAFDPRFLIKPDPMATYREPKTVLHDIRCALEWEPWLRLPKAKELGKPRFTLLKRFIDDVQFQMKETGLLSFPWK